MTFWSSSTVGLASALYVLLGSAGAAPAQPLNDYAATTEQSCSFGMDKGEPAQRCEVPIPRDCKVVHFPGTKKPWSSISKAGKTVCRFDSNASDWKTRIIGSCSRCDSIRCSAQFIVRFDCS